MEKNIKEEQTEKYYYKKKILEIDNQIDDSKKKIKKINDIHEELTALNKNTNKCIELLFISIKGKNKEKILNDMLGQNQTFYSNFSSMLDDEMLLTNKKINKLNEERDNLIKQSKEKNKEK